MNVEKEDKILFCRDCGEEFIFSAREQEFYIQKGFENDPARCGSCRAQRKRAGNAPMGSNMMNQQPHYNNAGGYGSNNYNNGNGNTRGGYGNFNPGYGSNAGYNNPRPNNGGYSSNQGNSYGNQGNSYSNNRGYTPRPNNYASPSPNNGGYSSNQGNSYGNQGNSYGNNRGGGGNGYPSNQGNSYGNSNGNYYPANQGNYMTNSGYDQLERKRYPIVCANCGIKTEVPFVPREGVPVFCRTCYNNQKPNHN